MIWGKTSLCAELSAIFMVLIRHIILQCSSKLTFFPYVIEKPKSDVFKISYFTAEILLVVVGGISAFLQSREVSADLVRHSSA